MKKCKDCKHFIGMGDFGTCCSVDYGLHYEDSTACDKWESKEDFTDNSKTA